MTIRITRISSHKSGCCCYLDSADFSTRIETELSRSTPDYYGTLWHEGIHAYTDRVLTDVYMNRAIAWLKANCTKPYEWNVVIGPSLGPGAGVATLYSESCDHALRSQLYAAKAWIIRAADFDFAELMHTIVGYVGWSQAAEDDYLAWLAAELATRSFLEPGKFW